MATTAQNNVSPDPKENVPKSEAANANATQTSNETPVAQFSTKTNTTEETAKSNLKNIAAVELIASWRTEMKNLNDELKKKYDANEDISESIAEVNKTAMTMFILAKSFKSQLSIEHQLEVTRILDQINENIADTAQHIKVGVEKAQLNPKLSSDHITEILSAPLDALRPATERMYNEISQTVREAGLDPNQFWEEYNRVHGRTEALARALREGIGSDAIKENSDTEVYQLALPFQPQQQ